MKQHDAPAIADLRELARPHSAARFAKKPPFTMRLKHYVDRNHATLHDLRPRELHDKLRPFVNAEQSAGRLTLSKEDPTPIGWQIKNLLHMIGFPLLGLLLSPLLSPCRAILPLCASAAWRKPIPSFVPPRIRNIRENLSSFEDHDVTNQFSAMGSLKPGLVRLSTTSLVLKTVNYGARHITRPGRLGRIRSIHFARWVFLARRERMIFCSNYDGSVESYMDDFINKTGFGLNASFSNGIGYPRTNWLVRDGCIDERNYKEYLRRHTLPSQVWYKAYPGLSAIDLERNTRIRQGLEIVVDD